MKRLTCLVFLFSCTLLHAGDRPSIAVADFTADRQNAKLAQSLPDLVADALINSKRFDVYERTKLATLQREQNLQTSGTTDADSAVALGKVAGVRYILTGQVLDSGQETRDFVGYGVQTRTTFYRLKAAIKVIDTQTGKVLFSKKDGAEQRLDAGRSMNASDSTLDTKLAETVAEKLVKALVDDDAFGAPPEPTPVATLVPVAITSVPDKADVEVDGVFYGNAGTEIKMPTGLHIVTVTLPGYEPWTKKVMIRDGLTLNAALVKKVDRRIEIQKDQ